MKFFAPAFRDQREASEYDRGAPLAAGDRSAVHAAPDRGSYPLRAKVSFLP